MTVKDRHSIILWFNPDPNLAECEWVKLSRFSYDQRMADDFDIFYKFGHCRFFQLGGLLVIHCLEYHATVMPHGTHAYTYRLTVVHRPWKSSELSSKNNDSAP